MAYPPVATASLVFVALAPLLAVSRAWTPRSAAAVWALGGALFWLGNLSGFLALRQHDVSWTYVVLGTFVGPLLRACVFAAYGGLSAWMWQAVRARPNTDGLLAAALFAEAFLWAGFEWIRTTCCPGLESIHLGMAICQLPGLAWPARWGGDYLLSALAVLVNGAVVTACTACRQNHFRRSMIAAALPVAAVAACMFLARPARETGPARHIRTVLVQRAAPLKDETKKQLNAGFDPLAHFGRLLSDVAPGTADLVVLPESALDEFGEDVRGPGAWRLATFLSAQTGARAVLAGGDSITPARRGKKIQSAAALYTFPRADESAPQIYLKRTLLPFGERNPLATWIPALRDASYFVQEPGRVVGLFRTGDIRLSPLVCFDAAVARPAREAAAAGAHMHVLISNDLWYAPSSLPWLHFWMAAARAVETGLPLVCAGNIGVTGVITPDGACSILTDTGTRRPRMGDAGVLCHTLKVPLTPSRTLYTRVGDLPILILAAVALVLALRIGWIPSTKQVET